MSIVRTDRAPGLGPKWVRVYTDFLLSAIGLRSLLRGGLPVGCAQDVLGGKIREVVEVADQLHALGLSPVGRIAGPEAAVWRAAVRYAAAAPGFGPDAAAPEAILADAQRVRDAWGQFCAALAAAPDDALGSACALDPRYLRPGALAHLFADRPRDPVTDLPGQPAGQPADEARVVFLG